MQELKFVTYHNQKTQVDKIHEMKLLVGGIRLHNPLCHRQKVVSILLRLILSSKVKTLHFQLLFKLEKWIMVILQLRYYHLVLKHLNLQKFQSLMMLQFQLQSYLMNLSMLKMGLNIVSYCLRTHKNTSHGFHEWVKLMLVVHVWFQNNHILVFYLNHRTILHGLHMT